MAAENNFQLYKSYSERDAAAWIGWDYSTLKRKRRAGLVPFVDMGCGSVAYMGYHIADIIVFGVKAKNDEFNSEPVRNGSGPWEDTAKGPSSLVSGSSISGMGVQPTTAPVTTGPPASSSALALARSTLKLPGKS